MVIKVHNKLKYCRFMPIIMIIAMFSMLVLPSSIIPVARAVEESVAAPAVTGAETSTDGSRVIITFDQALTALAESPAGFAVTANGIDDPISNLLLTTGDTCKIELILANPVTSSDAVVLVNYAPGTVSALDGGILASFENYSVTNKVPQPATEELIAAPAAPEVTGAETTVDGTKVIVTFNQALTAVAESPAGFSVKVNSTDTAITGTALAANDACKVELTLETPVTSSDTNVQVSYTPGTVTSLEGGVLAGFVDQAVTNMVPQPVIDTTTTRVSAYLTSINSDDTSTAGELIAGDTQVPLKPTIKLVFSNNVTYYAAQNIPYVSLQDQNGQSVSNVNIFTLGNGDRNDPEKTHIFLQPQDQLLPNSIYKIVISPEVTFKNGNKLGEPVIEIGFTTAAALPEVTLDSAVLSGQTLRLQGLPSGINLDYRIVTGSTSSDWNALTYTGTTATIGAENLSIDTGVSQVEVRNEGGAAASRTIYMALDGEQATMVNGKTLSFEDNVSAMAENLNTTGTNKISIKRYTLPVPLKYLITAIGFPYEVYLQGNGDGKKVTLSLPVDPNRNINKMSVYLLYKSANETGESNSGTWLFKYLTPDRSQANKNIISVAAEDVPEQGGTFIYQVFYDNTPPGPVGITAPAIVDVENHKIVFPQIQVYDMDCVSYVEVYRDGKMIGNIDGTYGFGTCTFTDSDPALQVGQTYTYNLKAYDRMGNWNWCYNNSCQEGEAPNLSHDYKVLYSSDASVFATVRQQIEDGTIPIIYADGDSADHVVTDIQLPFTTTVDDQIRIWWTSSEPNTIGFSGHVGVVIKPADGSNKEVTLTATITRGVVTDPITVSKKVRVTWEPWTNGVIPVHTFSSTTMSFDGKSELYHAINQESIKTIIIKDYIIPEIFTDNTLDAKGKTLVVRPFAFNVCGEDNAGTNIIIKNAVIDANGASDTSLSSNSALGYSFVALAQSRTGYIFENVEFKCGENLDSFILSHGGSLVLSNCRFGSTKVAPVIVKQGGAINEPTGIRIENCTFDGAGKPGYAVMYDKIGTLTAVNNIITGYQGTMTSGVPSAGLLITPGRTANLIGNKISNCDDSILVQTKSAANTTINGVKITDAASAATVGTALLESNELTAGSGPVVAVNNIDSIFHPVILYQAANDELTNAYNTPTWSADKTLTVSNIDEAQLTLTWSGVSDPAATTAYQVYKGGDLIATVTDTSYQVTGLMPDKTYQFRVEAGNVEGNWSFDGPFTSAMTLPNTPPVWEEGSKVTVTKVNSNSVILSWTPAADKEGLDHYYIYVNGENRRFTAPECLACQIVDLQPDTEYTFQIYAEDSLDVQGPGPSVTVKTAASHDPNWAAGGDIMVSNLKSTSLTLNWIPPYYYSEMKYKLYRNGVEQATFDYSYNIPPFTHNYNVTGLQPGTTYTFKLELLSTQDNSETTDGPSITVTTPAQGSKCGQIGHPVDIYLQGDTGWMNSINDILIGIGGAWADLSGESIFSQCTITPGHIHISADAFNDLKNDTIVIRANGYPDVFVIQVMTEASENAGSEQNIAPVYTITPAADTAYTVGVNQDGIKTMTINTGNRGFKYFSINVLSQQAHYGEETVVFVHLRNGIQIGMNAPKADFDTVNTVKAGFNVEAGDVVIVYVVDDLTNTVDTNPIILQ